MRLYSRVVALRMILLSLTLYSFCIELHFFQWTKWERGHNVHLQCGRFRRAFYWVIITSIDYHLARQPYHFTMPFSYYSTPLVLHCSIPKTVLLLQLLS